MKKLFIVLMALLMVVSAAAAKSNEEYSGTVMLYTSAGEDAAQSMKEVFEAKYPNVTLDFYAATSGKCNTKLATEFEAGNVSCDVVWLAEPSGLIDFKSQDRLLQYNSPFAEGIDPQFKDAENADFTVQGADQIANKTGDPRWLDTEGISTMVMSEEDVNAPVYNLAGQRVSPTTKGILIKNGKKYINR